MEKEELFDKYQLHILKKLFDMRCWMHKHTNINNLLKGLPPHIRSRALLQKVVNRLIKNGLLLSKPTHYGIELSLNIKKKKEIEEFIERDLE